MVADLSAQLTVERLRDAKVGDPAAEGVTVGPLATAAEADELCAELTGAVIGEHLQRAAPRMK